MKVLQVNKFLYEGAGAETVMLRTTDLLRTNGHEVSFFAMQDSHNLPCAESEYFPRGRYYGQGRGVLRETRDALASIYSLEARRAMRRLLREKRPDVAHLHNIYHQLTLSIVDELAAQHIPTVMTLHDYKPVCPSYVLYTEGAPCHRCVTGNPGHAVVHRCVKDSRAASAIASLEGAIVRARDAYGQIDAFISPSGYLADVMAQGGLPVGRIRVIPNFVADDQFGLSGQLPIDGTPMMLFVGRVEQVKGIDVLIDAAREVHPEIEVVVVGTGPLEAKVAQAQQSGIVRYVGRRDWKEIAALMDHACALVVPSLWEENCPMVVLEAGARGCPVIASDRGGLKELVDHGRDGLLFQAGDSKMLVDSIRQLALTPGLRDQMGAARRLRTISDNTSEVHYRRLIQTYDTAITTVREKEHRAR